MTENEKNALTQQQALQALYDYRLTPAEYREVITRIFTAAAAQGSGGGGPVGTDDPFLDLTADVDHNMREAMKGFPPGTFVTQDPVAFREQEALGAGGSVQDGAGLPLGWPAVPTTPGAGTILPEQEMWGLPAYSRGMQAAGLPYGLGGGTFGRFLHNRFEPTQATYLGDVAFRGGLPNAIDSQNPFAKFAERTRGGTGLAPLAQQAFEGLLNLGKAPVGTPIDAYQQRFLNPTVQADYELGAELAREAARGRMGGFAASRLLPSATDLAFEFMGSPSATVSNAFLPFLRRQLRV